MRDTFSSGEIGNRKSILAAGHGTKAGQSHSCPVSRLRHESWDQGGTYGTSPYRDVPLSRPHAVVICPKSAKPTRSNKLETHRNGSCVNPYQHQKVLSDGGADAGDIERGYSTHTKILESETDNEKSPR